MADRGKGKVMENPSAFMQDEWMRVQKEVSELSCWTRQEGEDLFHHRERVRIMVAHSQALLRALEEAWLETEYGKRTIADQTQTNLPPSPVTPATGFGSKAILGNTPCHVKDIPNSSRGLLLEEEPEEEEPEEEEPIEVPEAESDDDILVWEEELQPPEVIVLSDDSEEELEEEVWNEELDQLLGFLIEGGEGNPVIIEDEAMEEAVEEGDVEIGVVVYDETMEDSSSDGDDSGDDPDFAPASYHERADRRDGILP